MKSTNPQPPIEIMDEKTSKKVAKLAGRLVRKPETATPEEIKALAASCLTQAEDRPDLDVEDKDFEQRESEV